MKRLLFAFVILIAATVSLALNLRASHLFTLFPDRTAVVAGAVSGHSRLRAGRIRFAEGWFGTWDKGSFCGADPCWRLGASGPNGSQITAEAAMRLAGLKLEIREIEGRMAGEVTLPTLGNLGVALRLDSGTAELALRARQVLAGEISGFIEGLKLEGHSLGQGPVGLTVPATNRIRIDAQLDGGPSPLEAEVVLELSAAEGTVHVAIGNLSGFPADLQSTLRRITTQEGGRRHLRLRFALQGLAR